MSEAEKVDARWAADHVERRPVAGLVPQARNARTHSAAQIDKIAASIREWGWTVPILIDSAGGIIAGHGRVLAAQKLGIQNIPCMIAEGWTEAKKRAYTIADNRLALDAGWDEALLRVELDDLKSEGFDLLLTGFDIGEISELMADPNSGSGDPDKVPDVAATPVSILGDIWLLGGHRLMCGDSTSIEDVEALVDGNPIDCCWTDPPYNVNYSSSAGSIKNDHQSDADFRRFLLDAFSCAYAALKPGGAIYVAHADSEGLNFRSAFIEAGFKLSGCLVWVKNILVLGRSDYQWRHEPILYGWKPGAAHRWWGGRSKTTVTETEAAPFQLQEDGSMLFTIGQVIVRISGAELQWEQLAGSIVRAEKPRKSADHPTMKPVELILDQLGNSARPGHSVLDLFAGSGSTLIAAEMMGLKARLMEFDPRYADVIVRRFEEFSGKKAVLLSTGQSYHEVEAARCKAA